MRKTTIFNRLIPTWFSGKPSSGSQNGTVTPRHKGDEIVALEYQWINNEQLLREEGAVYGILGYGQDEKLDVIQKYFNKVLASLRVQILNTEHSLTAYREREQALLQTLENSRSTLDHFPERPHRSDHHFWRTFTGLLVYQVIIAATFYATCLWLTPAFGVNTVWVTLGVFLFGALSLFGHFPVLLHHEHAVQSGDKRENWKLLLEEIGIPVVATLFIICYGGPYHPWMHGIAMALFLFFVFIFAGKGLLACITAIVPQWRTMQSNHLQDRTYNGNLKKVKSEIKGTEDDLGDTKNNIQDKESLLAALHQEFAGVQVECEARKAYFMSEFTLAENARLRNSLFD
ncbi:MAG TPA: hypothetical protein PKB07_06985 [Flavilitoribacter sp.]|nr:hypothetical protein [Flavilitoribacter sp.]